MDERKLAVQNPGAFELGDVRAVHFPRYLVGTMGQSTSPISGLSRIGCNGKQWIGQTEDCISASISGFKLRFCIVLQFKDCQFGQNSHLWKLWVTYGFPIHKLSCCLNQTSVDRQSCIQKTVSLKMLDNPYFPLVYVVL